MTIVTKEFILRPVRLSDAKGYLGCHQDDDAKRNFTRVPTSVAAARQDLSETLRKVRKKEAVFYSIIVDDTFTGFIALHDMTKNKLYSHSACVSFGIHESFRGTGLATAALKAMIQIGFGELKLKRIWGLCRSYNKASARVLEKAGFKLEGILRKNKFINGKYVDDMVWARVR